MSLCHNLWSILNTYIAILVTLILQYKEEIDFILVSGIVQQGLVILNSWEPKVKSLIHFRNLFVKQNVSQKRNLSIYTPILKEEFANQAFKEYTAKKNVK